MTVPNTVLSIREQIRQGILLALGSQGTAINTFTEYSYYKTEDVYPLIKCYFPDTDELNKEYFSGKDRRQANLIIEVAPWCDKTNAEYETSLIIEGLMAYITTDVVREQMDAAYKLKLGKITCNQTQLIGTSLANPVLTVRFILSVDYLVN